MINLLEGKEQRMEKMRHDMGGMRGFDYNFMGAFPRGMGPQGMPMRQPYGNRYPPRQQRRGGPRGMPRFPRPEFGQFQRPMMFMPQYPFPAGAQPMPFPMQPYQPGQMPMSMPLPMQMQMRPGMPPTAQMPPMMMRMPRPDQMANIMPIQQQIPQEAMNMPVGGDSKEAYGEMFYSKIMNMSGDEYVPRCNNKIGRWPRR